MFLNVEYIYIYVNIIIIKFILFDELKIWEKNYSRKKQLRDNDKKILKGLKPCKQKIGCHL